MMPRIPRPRTNRLRFESLEDRRLLAVAALGLELYQDNDGVPGERLVDNTVTAGDTFFARITAQEFHRLRNGLRSVAVDVDWDAGLLSVVESDFQLGTVITTDLPMLQSGSLSNEAGTIDDLGATALLSSGAGRAIGNNSADTFAMIRMQAGDQAGDADIALSKSLGKKTITVPTAVMRERDLQFATETIVIVAADRRAPLSFDQVNVLEPPKAVSPDAEFPVAPASPIAPAPPAADEETQKPQPEQATELPAETVAPPTPVADVVADTATTVANTATPVAAADTSEPENTAVDPETETIDAVFTFDMNQDGVFDLGDIGLLNVHAAGSAEDGAINAEVAIVDDAAAASAPQADSENEILHSYCPAFPTQQDALAMEAWLDEMARAWLADADERSQRRFESLS